MSIDGPDNLICRPIDGIRLEAVMVAGSRMEGSSVIRKSLPLAEIVALNLIVVASEPFPIDFVKIIGLQDGTADNTSSWRGLDNEFDVPKHDVPLRRQLG